MKEIPIIYQTEMIRALLAGRKTNTRRLKGLHKINENPDDWEYYGHEMSGLRVKYYLFYNLLTGEYVKIKPQFGQKDDLLYVRENWQHTKCLGINPEDENYGYVYQADGEPWEEIEGWRWKPSIHLPKEGSRLWLRNTADPIPQRLQDISEADVIAEGIEPVGQNLEFGGVTYSGQWYKNYEKEGYSFLTPIDSFQSLICSIHGPEIWALNPYMWKIQFEVLSTTGKPELITEKEK